MQTYFNQYCLTKRVASKPSGSVYLAYRVQDVSQKVALETFDTAYCSFDQPTENFLQEVEKIKLLRHSSIVPILDVGVEQGQPYVVREYLVSDSLRHRLDYLSPQRMSLQEALTIVFQVGQVLCSAHEHHILHGYLKPETIFFNGDDEVLLSDFGLASFIDLTKLSHKSDLQMLNYLAPEQFVGSTTEKSDQYALACLAYELITGQMPFSAQNFPSIERDESGDIDQVVQAQIPSFCENTQCPDYGKVGRGNLRKFGKTRRGTQRWQCKTCQATLTFSPMSAKCHTKLPVSLSDLVPDLPRSIEAVVLKALAQDPSERYTDVSQFLRTLQVASASPSYLVSRSRVTPAFGTFIATPTEPPLEKIESEVTRATQLSEAASVTDLLEGSQH
ncbi:MAG TPA: serine/threonine-protein kinase, partial [Ktedonobacteraceae bacterium]|nr:serine/threonine-protein kinase [Ktedonobacteraceae bacterium]